MTTRFVEQVLSISEKNSRIRRGSDDGPDGPRKKLRSFSAGGGSKARTKKVAYEIAIKGTSFQIPRNREGRKGRPPRGRQHA